MSEPGLGPLSPTRLALFHRKKPKEKKTCLVSIFSKQKTGTGMELCSLSRSEPSIRQAADLMDPQRTCGKERCCKTPGELALHLGQELPSFRCPWPCSEDSGQETDRVRLRLKGVLTISKNLSTMFKGLLTILEGLLLIFKHLYTTLFS